MTPQEAIEAIKLKDIHIESGAIRITAFFQGLSVAKEALEKQIPKKIKRRVITSGIILYHCPVCNEHYYQINLNFCQHCGQALDWSDTE